jgi:hypothetical protein
LATTSANKIVAQLSQPEYALLKSLTDHQGLNAASLEKLVRAATRDRMSLARGLVKAAKALARNRDSRVRRSAVSRAYYAAYHAARATVFAIHHRDESDHEKLRNEMDYSPYPGPNAQAHYEPNEIEDIIKSSVTRATDLLDALSAHLKGRK